MPPASRIMDLHVCPMMTPGVPPIPHVGGPILVPGAPTVMILMMPAATVTSMCFCVGPPSTVIKGSVTVLLSGLPAARIGDNTAHGGTITMGAPTVMIGG
ncbi:MAG TPA: PAAR domain-containing protein [Gemmatimonas sp.]|uniref:PAAR domain-containing protein n=1 Tax=Gemmatimonas sp. TaxID=1962908 RepID=UPI002EDA6636